jgi:DNA relaxase NicK
MGESGGENVTFKVAGKESQNNVVDYANTTSTTLDSEWKRYEVDLAGADLKGITHLFGFEVNSGQTFYVKGAAYY